MKPSRTDTGFTLLEILIAMSILIVGATSLLGIFVAALGFQTQRVENNRVSELREAALHHAQDVFDGFDPAQSKDGSNLPPKVTVDLTDPDRQEVRRSRRLSRLADRFPGYKYEITFEPNPFAVGANSAIVDIRVYRLGGQEDASGFRPRE
ncbi:MAG: prepilin-type N-terminal cleavage/methylation domain-containing protein, partial [Planctomycetota bacterium]